MAIRRVLKRGISPVPGFAPHKNKPGVWIAVGSPATRNVHQKHIKKLVEEQKTLVDQVKDLEARMNALEKKK